MGCDFIRRCATWVNGRRAQRCDAMKGSRIKVLVADDDCFAREGLRVWLRQHEQLAVVGEAADGMEAVRLAAQLKPDVVIMDFRMPTLNGCEAAGRIRQAMPAVKVLFFSAYDDRDTVHRARAAGGRGHVVKGCDPAELVNAIERVHAGGTHFARRPKAPDVGRASEAITILQGLSPRLREVLALIARGCSAKEIAAELSISPRTAEAHRHHLIRRFGVHSVTQLTRDAVALDLEF
jgi:two-component system nitrate/nitrite response regulator NarL